MAENTEDTKISIGWYVAAIVVTVIIIAVGVITYEITLPNSSNVLPTSTPVSSPSISPSSTPSTSTSVSPSTSPAPSGSGSQTSLTLYAGSVTSGSGTYGYGDSASSIVSPGPTLHLKAGTTYTMTVHNAGKIPHSWEIVSTKATSNSPLFGAGINISSYIPPGTSASVTFTPDKAGNYYYVCTVPGHISLGMWGNVVVS